MNLIWGKLTNWGSTSCGMRIVGRCGGIGGRTRRRCLWDRDRGSVGWHNDDFINTTTNAIISQSISSPGSGSEQRR